MSHPYYNQPMYGSPYNHAPRQDSSNRAHDQPEDPGPSERTQHRNRRTRHRSSRPAENVNAASGNDPLTAQGIMQTTAAATTLPAVHYAYQNGLNAAPDPASIFRRRNDYAPHTVVNNSANPGTYQLSTLNTMDAATTDTGLAATSHGSHHQPAAYGTHLNNPAGMRPSAPYPATDARTHHEGVPPAAPNSTAPAPVDPTPVATANARRAKLWWKTTTFWVAFGALSTLVGTIALIVQTVDKNRQISKLQDQVGVLETRVNELKDDLQYCWNSHNENGGETGETVSYWPVQNGVEGIEEAANNILSLDATTPILSAETKQALRAHVTDMTACVKAPE